MRTLHGRGLHAYAFASGGPSRAALFATPVDAPPDVWMPDLPEADLVPEPEPQLARWAPPFETAESPTGADVRLAMSHPAPDLGIDAGTDDDTPAARAHCSPNPFVTSTAVFFDLAEAARVEVTVHDANGGEVRRLADGTPYPAGTHRVRWDGRDDFGREVESGTYVVKLRLVH